MTPNKHKQGFSTKQMKPFLSLFLLLLGLSALAQAPPLKRWNGSINSNWNEAANWTPNGVPTVTDSVLISFVLTPLPYPIVPTGTVARIRNLRVTRYLTIQAGATVEITAPLTSEAFYNDGYVVNHGTITVKSGLRAITNREDIRNYGTINLGESNASPYSFSDEGMVLEATGSIFVNYAGAVINIKRTGNNGILMLGTNDTFENYGQINIDQTGLSQIQVVASTGDGIDVQEGSFVNQAEGQINIQRSGANAFRCKWPGSVHNRGSLVILQPGRTQTLEFREGIQNLGSFFNYATGSITINEASNNALFNGSNFHNYGLIDIGASGPNSIDNFGVGNFNEVGAANFTNHTGGVLRIANVKSSGIFTAGIVDGGTVTNMQGATISINNTGEDGVQTVFQAALDNFGVLEIGHSGPIGRHGIFNTGQMVNQIAGTMSIRNTTNHAIFNSKYEDLNAEYSFRNGGKLTIDQITGSNKNAILTSTGSSFENLTCSSLVNILCNNPIVTMAQGYFRNEGNIIERATANSNINANFGVIQNLNGGTFTTDDLNEGTISSLSNVAVWTGCVSTDWENTGNWHNGQLPGTLSQVIIPATENNPIIGSNTIVLITSMQVLQDARIINNGEMNLAGVSVTRIDNQGEFTNNGILRIENTNSPTDYGLKNTGDFRNDNCGLLDLKASLNNSSSFENRGLFMINSAITLTNSNLSNRGIIEYNVPSLTIPNLNNNGIIVPYAISGSCTVNNPLQINNNNFIVGTTWTTSLLGTSPGAIYNQSSKVVTFTGVPGGSTSNLYFSIANNDAGCIHFVSLQATNVSQTPLTTTCPTTQTLNLGPNCSATLPNYTSQVTINNPCGETSVTQSPTPGTTVSGAGNMTVTLTVTDASSSTSSCTFTVTKVDQTPPTITCPGTQTLVLGANCTVTLPNYTSLATTGDNCGVQSVTQSPAAGTTVSGAGNMTVTLTVTDVNGLTNSCTFTVTKVDQTPPTITCPATQTLVLGANCMATLPNYTSLATAGDNCGVQSVTQSPTAGTLVANAGNMTVTLTVTDINGLTNTCTFTVTKVDNTAPTITCPAGQTLALGANCTATLPDYTSLATTGDNCGVQSVTQSPTAGTTVSGAGDMMVTLTVTDVNGRTNTCTFTVTKVDNTAPTITCPTTQTLALGANCTATLPNYMGLATTGDNCSVQSVTQSPTAGTSVSGAGNMTVTLTVTDINGKETECTFTVTKVDNTPPTITCPATQTLVLGANCTATLLNYTSLATAGDNCGVQSVTQSPTAGTLVANAGNMTVTLTVTDINGLTNTCTFTVTKVDNTAPTITCPATQTLVLGANCTVTLPNYTSLATTGDNCGVQGVTQSPTAGTIVSGAGNMTVTLTVTDVNGINTQCTFTVSKVDQTPPTIVCPATQTLVLGANCTTTLPNYTSLATTGDNCGVQGVTQSPAAGTPVSGTGNMAVTLTVTDLNGTPTQCTFIVTKVDQTPPTITCPGTQTLGLGANCTATLPDYTSLATTGDNCGVQGVTQSPTAGTTVSGTGNMTVTLTVTDVNGNPAQCSFTVTKVDQTPPTLVCKNTTVFIGNTGTYTLQSADVFNAVASSDNCSGTLTVTNILPAVVSCAQLNQTIPVTVTVQDGSGNTAICTAQITVQEGTGLPVGWSSDNVGSANGAAGYKACSFNGSFAVTASGFSTSSADVLHFASRQLCGNGEIIARVMNVSGGWAGVMLRESLTPGSKKVTLKNQLTNIIRREIRSVTNGPASILNFNRPQHTWLRLTRDGSNFVGYTSIDGTNWTFAFSATVSMTGCIYAGVFAESINAGTITAASFSNVTVTGGIPMLATPDNSDVVPFAAPGFEVYPNPTTGEVGIDLRGYADRPIRLELYDIQGKILKTLTMERTETMNINLDLSEYQNGIYLVRVKSEGLPDATKRVVLHGSR